MSLSTFKRIEKKYIVYPDQFDQLVLELEKYMDYDKFCQNGNTYLVQNIYMDTDNDSLISHSIQQPEHKVKIRIRHYVGDRKYFLEWKQKTNGIVSKRRICLSKDEYEDYINNGNLPKRDNFLDNQIIKELKYFFSLYNLKPALYLSYRRIAMFSKDDKDLRLTLDNKIRGSRTNFEWDQENPDIPIFDDDRYILEIKYNRNYPLWLARKLSELKIFHQSFSKYGAEYKMKIKEKKEKQHEHI